MDRREFLKILGLGGVALTLPKPLGIVAAKMADLQAPPLHVGYCEIGPLSDDERTFVWDRLAVGLDHDTPIPRYLDFSERWNFTMFLRKKKDDPASRVMFLKTTVEQLTGLYNGRFTQVRYPGDPGGPYVVPHEYQMFKSYLWDPDQVAEFWFTPASSSDLPRFPIPKLQLGMQGMMVYKKERQSSGLDHTFGGRVLHYIVSGEVKTVQLDRARAIEMGLVTPAEPEGIIS